MNKKNLFYFLIIIFLNVADLKANEVKIIAKVGTEIITNIDIRNEYKYLIALNNNYNSIEKEKINRYAKESLIREKIKKNEIEKFFELGNKNDLVDEKIKIIYKNLGFENITEFENYLNGYNLKIDEIYKKIEVEVKWNQLVYEKYRKQIIINKEILRKKLIEETKNRNSYNLSEIVFAVKDKLEFKKKYNQIIKSIEDIGFEKTVLIYSESSSSNNSGNLGWIDELSLSKVILNEIKRIDISEITKPIKISNSVLILKLNEKKKIDNISENLDGELSKLINFEKNRQLNTFSSIYFNKVKDKFLVNES